VALVTVNCFEELLAASVFGPALEFMPEFAPAAVLPLAAVLAPA
jgi:hypothetical protein